MKLIRVLLILALTTVTLSSCSFFGSSNNSGNQTPTDPLSAVVAANQVVRENVRLAMQQSAQAIGLPIQLDSFRFVSGDNFNVASALVQGFDQPLNFFDDNNRIVDLGVIYVDVPASMGIPRGFYKVRAFILQSRAELINAAGQPVVALPLEKFSVLTGSNKPMIQASGCDVLFIYNQPRQQSPNITVEVAVRIDWCPKLIGR